MNVYIPRAIGDQILTMTSRGLKFHHRNFFFCSNVVQILAMPEEVNLFHLGTRWLCQCAAPIKQYVRVHMVKNGTSWFLDVTLVQLMLGALIDKNKVNTGIAVLSFSWRDILLCRAGNIATTKSWCEHICRVSNTHTVRNHMVMYISDIFEIRGYFRCLNIWFDKFYFVFRSSCPDVTNYKRFSQLKCTHLNQSHFPLHFSKKVVPLF